MRDEMLCEEENRAASKRWLNASICTADDLPAPVKAPPDGVRSHFDRRRTLAKTNADRASGDADRIYSMPDMAKMLFSMLYQALQRVILRNPYPDWVCAALS
ncbi:hypothetical protein G3N95_08100 [Paraburkholderia sp. Tr-20389]|uniref:hypothetical protein n=1 Tax=Paraburkholderia sp. Tr-20389 TaxID=2703903 RepID=UPI00198122C4|nr:hypothetical protein [Paraburkholderia sp. Tr-20389]MBN3752902.1 hypothetical protein [Paraburkholderia sp. Tr-20389]